MTSNSRIALNILATYGRTLLGVACGIFSVRWVLMALGQESYGLFGVVGSLVAFISFFNIQFASALSRFYAYAIGQASRNDCSVEALENCRAWFSTGVLIHVALPTALVVVGYPIGALAITRGWLTIPVARYDVCVWLWRFVCISCWIGMVTVPFSAMYQAKQYIAELTVYSVIQVVARTLFIYVMTLVERDWLFDYGLAMMIIGVVPQLVIAVRAVFVFPECRLLCKRMVEWRRVREIGAYSWWQIVGGLGYMARHQCMEIVVNKYFGPKVNAAYTVAGTASAEAAALTGALNGAFIPAITTAYGAGDMERMRALSYRASKFGTWLTLPFAIPLGLEINEVLQLWLKTPPDHAAGLCVGMLIVVVIEKLTIGHSAAVNASGNIAKFQVAISLVCVLSLPMAVFALWFCPNVHVVAGVLVVAASMMTMSNVWFSRNTGLGVRHFMTCVVVPLAIVSICAVAIGLIPVCLLPQSFARMLVTGCLVEAVLLVSSWFVVLSFEERVYVSQWIRKKLNRT